MHQPLLDQLFGVFEIQLRRRFILQLLHKQKMIFKLKVILKHVHFRQTALLITQTAVIAVAETLLVRPDILQSILFSRESFLLMPQIFFQLFELFFITLLLIDQPDQLRILNLIFFFRQIPLERLFS